MVREEMISRFRQVLAKVPRGPLGDKLFLFIIFAYAHKRIPRRNSNLLNDYLYFLKSSSELLDIMRQYTSDKILVKSFVAERCGEQVVLPTLCAFYNIAKIDVSALSRPCVLKPAHGSGTVVFVDTRKQALAEEDRKKLQTSLESCPYTTAREANYKHLRRRIVCEPMLPNGQATKDYKVFCYQGEPKAIQVDSDRHSDHKRNLYTAEWEPIGISYNFPIGEWEPAPEKLSEILHISSMLSKEFEFVRVDFFIDDDKLYVAELTHCPESAHGRFESQEAERRFSSLIFSQAG